MKTPRAASHTRGVQVAPFVRPASCVVLIQKPYDVMTSGRPREETLAQSVAPVVVIVAEVGAVRVGATGTVIALVKET